MTPVIDPIEPSPGREPELGPALQAFADLGDDEGIFPRILAHVPNYAEALCTAMATALFEGGVDHRLKEIIRLQLAATAQDPYSSALRSARAAAEGLSEDRIQAGQEDFEDDPQFTDAEKWALRYAHLMYRRPEDVDAAFYEEGKRYYTEAQIMELGGLIAIHYGMQVFMRTLQPDPA